MKKTTKSIIQLAIVLAMILQANSILATHSSPPPDSSFGLPENGVGYTPEKNQQYWTQVRQYLVDHDFPPQVASGFATQLKDQFIGPRDYWWKNTFPIEWQQYRDDDNDNVADVNDNCPTNSNTDQRDADVDGMGDLCDSDDDNDGVADSTDNCPTVRNSSTGGTSNQTHTDGDGIGDACDVQPINPNNDVVITGSCQTAAQYDAALTQCGASSQSTEQIDTCMANAGCRNQDGCEPGGATYRYCEENVDLYGNLNQCLINQLCIVDPNAGGGNPPEAGSADTNAGGGNPPGAPIPSISIKITNPLKAENLQELMLDIIELLIGLGIPLIVVMIIYSGFLYVTAQGNAEKISKAHDAIKWTIVGAAILLGSMAIVEIIKNTIDSLRA